MSTSCFLLLRVCSSSFGQLSGCQYWIRKRTDCLNWLINCQSKQSTFVASSFLHQPSCKKSQEQITSVVSDTVPSKESRPTNNESTRTHFGTPKFPFWDTKIAVFEVDTALTDLSEFLKALKPALGLRWVRTNKGSHRRIWAQDRCWNWICMGRGQRGCRGPWPPPPPPARTRTRTRREQEQKYKKKNKDSDRKPTNSHLVSSL